MAKRDELIKGISILFALFTLAILFPLVMFGRMWGKYEEISTDPHPLGLFQYILESPEAMWIAYVMLVFVVFMAFLFKLRKGRIV